MCCAPPLPVYYTSSVFAHISCVTNRITAVRCKRHPAPASPQHSAAPGPHECGPGQSAHRTDCEPARRATSALLPGSWADSAMAIASSQSLSWTAPVSSTLLIVDRMQPFLNTLCKSPHQHGSFTNPRRAPSQTCISTYACNPHYHARA